jgi:hypothetical protein
MKDLLTVRIIFALESDFLNYLITELKQDKRQTLLQLLKLLLSKRDDDDIDRATVSNKIFKKKWTKENDYLLRNELKLLKDKIEEIYIKFSTSKYIKNIEDKIRLDFYKQIKISDEYLQVYKNYQNKQLQQLNLHNAIENSFEYADYIRINTSNYEERAKLMEENMNAIEENLMKYFSIQQAKVYTLQAHLLFQKKQLSNQKNTIHFEYHDIQVPAKSQESAFNDYCLAYANAYVNFDTSTIEQWEEVYTLFQKIDDHYTRYDEEKCLTLSNLATICSIRNQYQKSEIYFKLLFEQIPENITKKNMAIYLNYITNFNKLKMYAEATEQLKIAEKIFGKLIRKTAQFRTQELVAAVYLNDIAKLKKLMTIDFETLQPFERIFYRLFYCIYFIQEEQFEMAFVEIQNLQRSKLINETDRHFELIADYFYVCIKYLNNKPLDKKISQKIRNEIMLSNQKIIDSKIPMLINYSPYLWMQEKVNKYFD